MPKHDFYEDVMNSLRSIESSLNNQGMHYQKMYSLQSFWKIHDMTKSTWDVLPLEFKPELTEIGRRKFVTREAAARWREMMTNLSNEERRTLRAAISAKRQGHAA